MTIKSITTDSTYIEAARILLGIISYIVLFAGIVNFTPAPIGILWTTLNAIALIAVLIYLAFFAKAKS